VDRKKNYGWGYRKMGRSRGDDLYPKRVVVVWHGREQVAYHRDLVPFNELAADDLLNTADLQQYFGVSARTVYRWIAEDGLEPDEIVGRDYLFKKRTVLRWEKQSRPRRGRL
jgi:excisionase family DNA binding protein